MLAVRGSDRGSRLDAPVWKIVDYRHLLEGQQGFVPRLPDELCRGFRWGFRSRHRGRGALRVFPLVKFQVREVLVFRNSLSEFRGLAEDCQKPWRPFRW